MVEPIERAVAQNLADYVTAVSQVAPDFGAAAIPCAGGIAAFVGKGSPLTTVKGAGPEISDHDLDAAEAVFRNHGAGRSVFELAPWISQSTAALLHSRGYMIAGVEDVLVRCPPYDAAHPSLPVVRVPSSDWPALMLAMNGSPSAPDWRVIVEASARLPGALHFAVLADDGAYSACAEIMPVGGVALFGNAATLESARGRGAQTAVLQARLNAIRSAGFSSVAAEVAPGSTSERNCLRNGFTLAYSRSHYVLSLA